MFSALARSTLFAALALAATATYANPFWGADGVTGGLTFQGGSNGYSTVNIAFPGLVTGSPGNVSTGQDRGTFDPVGEDLTTGAEADDFFRFFCIDLYQWASRDTLPYTRTAGVLDATNAWQLTRLFENVYPNKATGNFLGGSSTNFGNFPSADASAAMQLAVWEIWFDDGLSLGSGALQATGSASVVGVAQGYLDAIAASDPSPAPGWQLYRFENANNQDYLAATYVPPPVRQQGSVPLPGTLALLGIGLAALRFSRRKQ